MINVTQKLHHANAIFPAFQDAKNIMLFLLCHNYFLILGKKTLIRVVLEQNDLIKSFVIFWLERSNIKYCMFISYQLQNAKIVQVWVFHSISCALPRITRTNPCILDMFLCYEMLCSRCFQAFEWAYAMWCIKNYGVSHSLYLQSLKWIELTSHFCFVPDDKCTSLHLLTHLYKHGMELFHVPKYHCLLQYRK